MISLGFNAEVLQKNLKVTKTLFSIKYLWNVSDVASTTSFLFSIKSFSVNSSPGLTFFESHNKSTNLCLFYC